MSKPGEELRDFFQKIKDAENKIMTMYRATRPVEQALFEVHVKKEAANKEYKRLRVEKETMVTIILNAPFLIMPFFTP